LAFVTGRQNVGDLYFLEANMAEVFDRELHTIMSRYNLSDDFVGTVVRATRDVECGDKVAREVLDVSKSPYVRDLVGLGVARPQAQEPLWAAERLLRIGNVVKFYAAAEQLAVDIVEFEPGLARLALARWGSRVRFHRVYQAIDELQAAFAAAALPDIGALSRAIGTDRCVEIADSPDGTAFRTWFWETAAAALAKVGSFEGEVAGRLRSLSGVESPIPRELLVAVSEADAIQEGLAARPGGEEALRRQIQFSAQRLREHFEREKQVIPTGDSRCLCGSDEVFATCCGRILNVTAS
jgi:hypothetical protein